MVLDLTEPKAGRNQESIFFSFILFPSLLFLCHLASLILLFLSTYSASLWLLSFPVIVV